MLVDEKLEFRKECLYDVEWQRLRISLLARNSSKGGFATVEGVESNIERLGDYLRVSPEGKEFAMRLWRVQNLLAAVLLGYGGRGGVMEARVQTYHREISSVYAWHKEELKHGSWDWLKVLNDLRAMYESGAQDWRDLFDDLKKRVKTANRKQAAGKGGMQYRRELAKFMRFMYYIDKSLDGEFLVEHE